MSLLDFLFPKSSLQGEEGEWVTAAEIAALRAGPIVLERTQLDAMGCTSLDRIVACAHYHRSPLLKKAIARFKYVRLSGVSESFDHLLASAAPHITYTCASACITPVPLHWLRKFERGFNQAEILARMLHAHSTLPVRVILRRVRSTGHQAHRRRAERLSALRDVFRVYLAGAEMPQYVVLIDDVCTTGSTLQECAKVLKSAGVLRVEAVTLALG